METGDFWRIIETARASAGDGKPFHEALTEFLASRGEREIVDFQEKFYEVSWAVYRWDMWAAAYLIGAGCSNDAFTDFRAGLIAQGRDWYQRAAESPDSLADHPAVIASVGRPRWENPLFYERAGYAASYAFQCIGGDREALYDELAARGAFGGSQADMGEDFDFDDEREMSRRLPRLWALCW
jgi:hypothetical protein